VYGERSFRCTARGRETGQVESMPNESLSLDCNLTREGAAIARKEDYRGGEVHRGGEKKSQKKKKEKVRNAGS